MGRPVEDFNDFIGQPKIIDHAKRFIADCHFAGAAFPSSMLIGPSGFGKTALAESIDRGFGTDIHKIFAGSGIKPVEVCQVLAEVKFGDFVFIDEVHSLDRDCPQLLYLAPDERESPGEASTGACNRIHPRLRSGTITAAAHTFSLVSDRYGSASSDVGVRRQLELRGADLIVAEQVGSRGSLAAMITPPRRK